MAIWDPTASLSDEFFQIARNVYKEDPNWLPEDESEIRTLFGPKNPFFEVGKVWLATAGNTRLVGIFDPRVSFNEQKVAYFGFWETGDEQEVNQSLFSELEEWAKGQGADAVYGPVNFSTYQDYRLRLTFKGQHGPFPAEPYNPESYNSLMGQLGYSVAMKWESQIMSEEQITFTKTVLRPMVHQQLEAGGIVIESFTPELWLNNIENFYDLINVIWADNFGYYQIDFESFKMIFGQSLLKKLCPQSSVVFFEKDSRQLAGYFISYPDYAPLIRNGNPDRIPYNQINFKEHRPLMESPAALGKSGAVHPKYRKVGLFSAMAVELASRASDAGYSHTIAALMRSDNPSTKIRNLLPEGLNYIQELREYGLYSKDL